MKKAMFLLLALLAIGAFLGRDQIKSAIDPRSGPQPTAQATAATTSIQLSAAPLARTRLALLDPTTSTDATFREAMKALLVADVRDYVPAKPSTTKDGVPPVVGVHLVVRLVGTSPLTYGAPIYTVDIPSVAELPARPSMTADGALDPGGPYSQWTAAASSWSTQYDVAIAAAQQASAALQGLNLEVDQYSAVTAGVASLALLAPQQGDVAYLVMSDLDENRAQEAADFRGSPVLVVQPDPDGSEQQWSARYQAFAAWAVASGAGQIDRVRPEACDAAIKSFIQGA